MTRFSAARPSSIVIASVLSVALWLGVVGRTEAQTAQTWDHGGADLNWSTIANWNPDGAPSGNPITFNATGAVAAKGTVTSIVDLSTTITSLSFTQTSATQFHTLQIASGATLTISGTTAGVAAFALNNTSTGGTTNVSITGPGALVVNNTSNNDFIIGTTGTTASTMNLDMTGLASFTATVRNFSVASSATALENANVTLADSSTITATSILVGNESGSPPPGNNSFLMGQTTVLNSNTILIAGARSSTTWGFRTGLSGTPTLTIRNTAGTGRADLSLGNNNLGFGANGGGSSFPTATANFNGGNIDFLLNNLALGFANSVTSALVGHGVATMTFNQGTVDATTVTLGRVADLTTAGTDPNAAIHATLSVQGGTFIAGSISIAENQDGSTGVNAVIRGELDISGGTTTVANNITMGSHSSATPSTGVASAVVKLTGGTITVNGNITEGTDSGNNSSSLTLDGATLDMTAGIINVDTFTAASGTLKNLLELSSGGIAGATLTKTTGGTLILDGANTYTGATDIQAGILQVGTGGTSGTLGTGAINVNGVLAFNRSDGLRLNQTITGTNGELRQMGTGVTVISGVNTALTGAIVNVQAGTLEVTNVSALGNGAGGTGAAQLNVSSGATFSLRAPVSGASLLVQSLNMVSGSALGISIGNTLGVSNGTTALPATVSGTITVNISGNPAISTISGPYTLVTAASGLNGATFTKGKVYNATNFSVGAISQNDTSVSIAVTAATPLTAAFWKGGFSGGNNVWAISDGNGTAGTSNWATTAAGTTLTGLVPGATTAVTFSATGATQQANTTLGADMSIKSLTISDTTAVGISDSVYTLTIVDNAGISVPTGAGAATISSRLALTGAAPTISVVSTNGLTLSGVLSGNGFTKSGAGPLTLSGANSNTYTGTVTMTAGTLNLNKTPGLNAITGNLTITGGTVRLLASNQIADTATLAVNGGVFDMNGQSEAIDTLNGTASITNNVVATSTLTVGSNNGGGTFSGVISNGATTPTTMIVALTKVGSGTLTLSGTNTYTGATNILAGTLRYGASNVIATGSVNVNGATAVWDLNGFNDSVGTVVLDNGGQIIGTNSTLTSTAAYDLRNGTVSANLSGAVGLNKTTAGTVILSGVNSYTGTTNISGATGGILRITNGSALGTTAGGTTVAGGADLSRLEIANNIIVAGETLTLGGRSTTTVEFSNLSGNNIWAGNVTFGTGGNTAYNIESQAGTLTISGTVSAGGLGSARPLILSGAGNGLISGPLIDGGGGTILSVTKTGAGTWVLGGVDSFTGTTTVSAGTLRITNSQGLGTSSGVTVSTGGDFQYASGIANNNLTLAPTTGTALTLATGSSIGGELGNKIIVQSGAVAAATGSIKVDVFGISGQSYAPGNYNLITASSGLSGATYSLGNVYNATNFTVSGVGVDPTVGANAVFVTIAAASELTTAYWKGGFAGAGNVWAISDGATASNWASDVNGTDTPLVPGASTNVIFSSTVAVNENNIVMGSSMTINSLTVNDPTAVTITDTQNTLTIGGNSAITVNASAGATTLGNVILTGSAPVLTVNNAAGLTLASLVGGNGFTVNGTASVAVGNLNLAGAAPVLTLNNTAMTVSGSLSGNGFTKNGSATLTLNGTAPNTYIGAVTINGGALNLGKTPGATAITGDLTIASGASLKLLTSNQIADTSAVTISSGATFDLGGQSEAVDKFTGAGTVTNSGSGALSTLTVGANNGNSTISGSVQNGSGTTALVKNGTGTLTMTGSSNNYTGGTTVNGGTLIAGANNTLPTLGAVTIGTGSSTGTLDMSTTSQTISSLNFATSSTATPNLVTIGKGQTLNISGTGSLKVGLITPTAGTTTFATITGGGALNVTNGSGNFEVGIQNGNQNSAANTAQLDLTGLGSFTANVADFRVGYDSQIKSTLLLSNSSNTIVATNLQVGNSLANNGQSGLLVLGTGTNVIQADTINIGQGKAPTSTVQFASQAAGSAGTLTITNKAGSGGANINVGTDTTTGTAATPTGILDLTGHVVNITANALTIGRRTQAGTAPNGGAMGTVNFDGGTFTVSTLDMGDRSNVGATVTSPVSGTLNISGGVFTVTGASIILAKSTDTGPAAGTLNITGGAFVTGTDITDGGGGTATTSTVTLNGGTLNMQSHNIGSATNNVDVLNFQSGTLQNVGLINGTGGLTKTGTGELLLAGTSAFTGATTVSAGTLLVNSSFGLFSTSGVSVANGATFHYVPIGIGELTLAPTTGVVFSLADGSRVGSLLDNAIVVQSGATASATGTISVDVFAVSGNSYNDGKHYVVKADTGLTGATYVKGNVYNASTFTVSGVGVDSTGVYVTTQTADALTSAYWKGGFSGGNNVWALSDGTSTSNWAKDATGTATGLVPGATTDVFFSATGATNQTSMVLGADMTVQSLTFSDPSAVALVDTNHTLTLFENLTSNNSITVQAGAGPVTLNTNLVFGDNASGGIVAVNGASQVLTLGGSASGSGLAKNGVGTVVLAGTNNYSGNVNVNAGTLLVNSTLNTGGFVIVATGAKLGGTGSVTISSGSSLSLSGTLSIGNSTLPTPTAGKLSVFTTSGSGGSFSMNGGTISFDIISGAGGGNNTLNAAAADQLLLAGDVNITAGVIQVTNPNNLTGWAAGDIWKLFDWSQLNGASVNGSPVLTYDLPVLGSNLAWDTSHLFDTSGSLSGSLGIVAVAPEPGRAFLLLAGLLCVGARRRRPSPQKA